MQMLKLCSYIGPNIVIILWLFHRHNNNMIVVVINWADIMNTSEAPDYNIVIITASHNYM